MSLLPQQILPQDTPFGRASPDGMVKIDHDWWLLLYNLCQQVLGTSGAIPISDAELLSSTDSDAADADAVVLRRPINNALVLAQNTEDQGADITALQHAVGNALILAQDNLLPDTTNVISVDNLQQPLELVDGTSFELDTPGVTHGIVIRFTYGSGTTIAGYVGNGSEFFAGAAMADFGLWCHNGTLRLAYGTSGNTGFSISNVGACAIPGTLGLSGSGTYGSSWLGNVSTSQFGFAAGAGGAVTQTVSRSTGVTLNKICGAITLFSAAGVGTATTFTVTNSLVAATDVVVVCQKSGTDAYEIDVTAIAASSFTITFLDLTGVTVEQPVFNFVVIKAAAS